ncbi:MAG: PAS domain-containing sensor histidine kinase [Desulfovibrionales bacterium]|nr:MAG: PAS domain-containing sensor histidine kinase [Desulfovibrionales bacterium]
MSEIVYILGIVLQAAAGIMALMQVRSAPHRLPWFLIAISSLLIVFRRSATLGEFIQAERELAPAEVITLIVSLLFFLGVLLMARMFRDISVAQEALKENEQHFRLLADNAPDGIFIQVNYRFAYLNKACLRHFGAQSEEDLLGQSVIDRFHPDIQHIVRERIRLLNEDRQPVALMEQKHIRLDGEPINAEVSAAPFQFKGEKGALVFVRNIEKRKKLELALTESEKKFRTFADFTADWEYWQGPDGRFIYVTPSCEGISGYAPDMFMQDPKLMLRIIHPEDRATMTCLDSQQNRPVEGVHVGTDLRIITRAQEIRWIAHRCHAVSSSDGKFLGRRGSNRDITEHKLREDEIRKINQQLQQANSEKDMLFSIIGHDLRSPMSGILASTTMLVNDHDTLSRKDSQALFNALRDSAVNIMALLEDLLQWARMNQGGIEYEPSPCSLHALFEQSLAMAQNVANRRQITLHMEIAPHLSVVVDKPMIKTVIRNILLNAIKFTHQGGAIHITARLEDQKAIVAVQDNGIGMDKHVLASIFSLEKKNKRQGTDGEKGTGLGLILCRQFIDQHGGRIWVESEPDKGTTVFFTLPIAEKH